MDYVAQVQFGIPFVLAVYMAVVFIKEYLWNPTQADKSPNFNFGEVMVFLVIVLLWMVCVAAMYQVADGMQVALFDRMVLVHILLFVLANVYVLILTSLTESTNRLQHTFQFSRHGG
ncbi:MAG: hypothetical protein LR017_01250 [Candidatus Pacebacteria bacterium]|nr:hypothetical protein [Candidatus Paceibacterota bacterium]